MYLSIVSESLIAYLKSYQEILKIGPHIKIKI